MFEKYKKEKPFQGLAGFGGGVVSRCTGGGSNLEFPSCSDRPTDRRYMWYTTIENDNSDNYFLCNGDSHFNTGSTIKNVTTGDPADPIGGNFGGIALIRFGTPRTVIGANFGWLYQPPGSTYCAGNGFWLITDEVDGLGPIRNSSNPDTSNKTLDEWKTYYEGLGQTYFYTINYNSGSGCNNPNTYNYPSGSFSYENIRWVAVTTGRPGRVQDYSGTAGNGAFIITTDGNINM